jgi:transposase InsO family protein
MAQGFMYLVGIIDVFSRKTLSFRLSNTLTTDFCVDALQEALDRYGKPEIFNTDQGSQFISKDWTDVLDAAGVRISMDGKGRWVDNVFIERLWRFCAHSRYVAWRRPNPCTSRLRSSLRTHNGAIGDNIRLPAVGQRGDCHAGTLLRQAGVC